MTEGFRIEMSPTFEDLFARLGDDIEAGRSAGMTNLVGALESAAVKEAPVKTSNLVNAIASEVSGDGMTGTVRVTDNAPYAIYVHEGTGIYGPLGEPILPKEKKALYWPGAAHPVKSVKGQKPNPFMDRAMASVSDPAAVYARGLMNYLEKRGW